MERPCGIIKFFSIHLSFGIYCVGILESIIHTFVFIFLSSFYRGETKRLIKHFCVYFSLLSLLGGRQEGLVNVFLCKYILTFE